MKRHVKTLLGITLSLLLLGWAMRDVSAEEVLTQLRDADLFLLSAAGRLLAAPLALRLHEDGAEPASAVFGLVRAKLGHRG